MEKFICFPLKNKLIIFINLERIFILDSNFGEVGILTFSNKNFIRLLAVVLGGISVVGIPYGF